MKLSKEDKEQIATIDARLRNRWSYDVGQWINDCETLREIIEKNLSKPHRFTYEMRDCKQCDGVGEVGASMNQFACDVEKCKACGGLGKIRTKVARK